MNKFVVNKFGLVTLTIIFILLYGCTNVFDGLGNTTEIADRGLIEKQDYLFDKTISDSRFLVDVQYIEKDSYYRISIPVKTNSAFANNLALTPQVDVQQFTRHDLPEIYKFWVDTEDYCIKISIVDSAPVRIDSLGAIEGLIDTKNIQVRNDLITDIDLLSVEKSVSDILIGLNKEVEFSVDQNEAGIIFIDILK